VSGNYDSRGIRRHSWDCLFKLGARWEGLKCYSRPSGWSPKAKKNISNWKPSFLWIQMFYTALPKDSKLLSRPLQTSNFLKSAGPIEMPCSCRSYNYHHRKTRVLPIYSRSFTHNICVVLIKRIRILALTKSTISLFQYASFATTSIF